MRQSVRKNLGARRHTKITYIIHPTNNNQLQTDRQTERFTADTGYVYNKTHQARG